MEEGAANGEEIGFDNRKIPAEDLDELALDHSNGTLSEGTGDYSPVNIFQSRFICVFRGGDESAEENAMKGPQFGLNREMRLYALEVDEGDKDVGGSGLCSLENI